MVVGNALRYAELLSGHRHNGGVWSVYADGSNYGWYSNSYGVRPVLCFSSALLVSVEDEREAGFSLSDVPLDDLLAEIKSRTEG